MAPYTYGSANYRPITQSDGFYTEEPHPEQVGEWLHIPYGDRNLWEEDSGHLHTVWQVAVELPDAADYTAMRGYYRARSFVPLVTPWGTFSAKLRQFKAREHEDRTWEGQVVWEWA